MPTIAATRTGLWLASASVIPTGFAGCGSSTPTPAATVSHPPVTLDTARVERAIEQSILTQRHIRAVASCPSGVLQRKGLTFSCLVTYTRGKATFVVNQLDDRGNGHYRAQ
ncbi:MAG TPA: hypothetical protein VHW26_07345 [Solirubrobacteraceae bacterium]|nr:hypothetical protein [Solirubrobacteraceae bacterium]